MSTDNESQSIPPQDPRKFQWVILVVILLGAFLRWADFGSMKAMMYYE